MCSDICAHAAQRGDKKLDEILQAYWSGDLAVIGTLDTAELRNSFALLADRFRSVSARMRAVEALTDGLVVVTDANETVEDVEKLAAEIDKVKPW